MAKFLKDSDQGKGSNTPEKTDFRSFHTAWTQSGHSEFSFPTESGSFQ